MGKNSLRKSGLPLGLNRQSSALYADALPSELGSPSSRQGHGSPLRKHPSSLTGCIYSTSSSNNSTVLVVVLIVQYVIVYAVPVVVIMLCNWHEVCVEKSIHHKLILICVIFSRRNWKWLFIDLFVYFSL